MKTRENRINSDPNICGGRSRIRNTRIRVINVLELLSKGLSFDNILAELPNLEKDDIKHQLIMLQKRLIIQLFLCKN